jgi:hypothetical protein
MDKEIAALLYIALATAAGGRDLLEDSNQILRTAVQSGSISHPDTRQAIIALLATTSRDVVA